MFQGMEYIYEVYKEKSFSKAAAALFISQPSLSANVKRVENRIGYPISVSYTHLTFFQELYIIILSGNMMSAAHIQPGNLWQKFSKLLLYRL